MLGLSALMCDAPAIGAQSMRAIPAVQTLSVAEVGFAARLTPATTREPRLPVLVLNGSQGGYAPELLAESLSRAGHSVLPLAYVNSMGGAPIPGLPNRLYRVSLESVERAVDWLRTRTEKPVVVMGESRGAELALLLATRRTDIAGVVAFAPSSVVWPAVRFLPTDSVGPAWVTADGAPEYLEEPTETGLTSVERFSRALSTGAGAARIPVERITGKILLVAGEDDRIWPSTVMADSIAAHVRRQNRPAVKQLRYPNAGHLLMGPGPGRERFVSSGWVVEFGGSEQGNRAARDDAWAKTLAFLSRLTVEHEAR